MADDFARARNLLLGAVDTVLSLANQERAQNLDSSRSQAGSGSSSRRSTQEPGVSSSHLSQRLTQDPGNSSQLSRRSTQDPGNSLQLSQRSTEDPGNSLQLSRRSTQDPGNSSHRSTQEPGSSPQISRWQTLNVSIDEHRRLFGYRPTKSKTPFTRTKRNRGRRKGSSTWKKDCICLRDKEQTWKPSSEEKIELARMGLGLSEAVFNSDGDAEHIHQVLLEKFPVLESCGGYTLMRLAENSHSMVEIEGPDSGMTVSYLKDILNQAKLYIRPLQRDISEEDMKSYSIQNVRNVGPVRI